MSGYKPIYGFMDLREYKIPKKEFKKFWEIQKYLKHVNDNKEYFMKYDLITWQKAQEMSASYQQALNNYANGNV